MAESAIRTAAWVWLPALLLLLLAIATVRWAEGPGGPLGGASQRCSTSAMAALWDCR